MDDIVSRTNINSFIILFLFADHYIQKYTQLSYRKSTLREIYIKFYNTTF